MKKAIIKVLSGEGSTSRTLRDEKGDINTQLDEHEKLFRVIDEIDHHSIAPTTFNERVFEEDLDHWWYKDKYKTGDNNVVHFGINATSSRIISDIIPYNVGQDLSAIITSGKIPVARVVSDSRSIPSSTSTNTKPPQIALCAQEKLLLQKAIDYVIAAEQRCVLVDILARERAQGDGYGAAIMKEGVLDVHTIVLYRNPSTVESAEATSAKASVAQTQDIVLVIDPSNFAFSSHLANFTSSNPQQSVNVIALTHKMQIYKAAGGTGPKITQYRDCTDIAAKIAFGLNTEQPMLVPEGAAIATKDVLESTKENIKACSVFQNISNTKIDPYIFKEDLHVRIKQSSNLEVSRIFNDIVKITKDVNDKVVYFIPTDQRSVMLNRVVDILETTPDYCGIIQLLDAHNTSCIEQIHTYINSAQEHSRGLVELAGNVLQSLADSTGEEV